MGSKTSQKRLGPISDVMQRLELVTARMSLSRERDHLCAFLSALGEYNGHVGYWDELIEATKELSSPLRRVEQILDTHFGSV